MDAHKLQNSHKLDCTHQEIYPKEGDIESMSQNENPMSQNRNSRAENQISTTSEFPRQLSHQHGFSHRRIIELIKGALSRVPVDPIPKHIKIYNIQVAQIEENNLEISCEVYYES